MANLHIINKPLSSAIIYNDDQVVLLQDGVYSDIQHDKVCAIEKDVLARGLSEKIAPHIKLISYEDFVELTIDAESIISW